MIAYLHRGGIYLFAPEHGEIGPLTPATALALADLFDAAIPHTIAVELRGVVATLPVPDGDDNWPDETVRLSTPVPVAAGDGHAVNVRIAY